MANSSKTLNRLKLEQTAKFEDLDFLLAVLAYMGNYNFKLSTRRFVFSLFSVNLNGYNKKFIAGLKHDRESDALQDPKDFENFLPVKREREPARRVKIICPTNPTVGFSS